MAGYTRQDTTNNIADGNVINAADFDNEYDAIAAAFHKTTGHSHDGTDAEGAAITKVGPSQDVVVSSTAVTPKTDNTVDLGSSLLEFKDLYIDGVANIDNLVADTADINAGTVDNVVIGGATAAAGTFTTLTSTGTTTLNGTTIPASATLLSTDSTQTLTNKTISADNNTISGIAASSFVLSDASGNIDGSAAQKVIPSGAVVGTSDTQTLTNKTISADNNTISGIAASSFVLSNASGNVDGAAAQKAIPSGDVVGTSDAQTLTNKTIDGSNNTITNVSLSTGVTGTLPVNRGGTGAVSLSVNSVLLGNGTSSLQQVFPGTNGNVLTSNGTTWVSQAPPTALIGTTLGTSPFSTFLGYYAGAFITTGSANTFIGYASGVNNNTGYSNSAVGYQSFYSNTSGWGNSVIGLEAMKNTTTGSENSAVGYFSLRGNTSGYGNCAVGSGSLSSNTVGFSNTAIGISAGNTITSGSNLTCIGNNAQPTSATATNEITLGNNSVGTLRCATTTITSLSDARDKTNIVDLSAGLEFVNALRPVAFDWNMRDGGKVGDHDTGFIAQDLVSAQNVTGVDIPGLVYDVNPEKLEAGYGKLIPVLVKAIQELSTEVESLKSQLKGA